MPKNASDDRLHSVRVTAMQVDRDRPGEMALWLAADGPAAALDTLQNFANASWLGDLELPYLDDLLCPEELGRGVSLREEGWAVRDGDWVRVSDSHGDAGALVAWDEFRNVMQLKRRFLALMQRCQGQGVPRYGIGEGFRVRLHAPGCMPA